MLAFAGCALLGGQHDAHSQPRQQLARISLHRCRKRRDAVDGRRGPESEYYWFAGILTVIAIAVFAVVVIAGMDCLLAAIGGDKNMPNTPESPFFLSLALECIVQPDHRTAGCDAPLSRLGRPDLSRSPPSSAQPSLIMTAAVLPLWIFVPADSKFPAMVKVVVPLLSPLVSGLTTVHYFTARLKRTAQ